MFFNRHVRQGEEIGRTFISMLRSSASGTKLHDSLHVIYSPPISFFLDSYVMGFIHSAVGHTIILGLRGENWSRQKKGQCVMKALNTIDQSGTLAMSLIGEIDKDEELYLRGANDGTTVAGLVYGKLKSDDVDPKVVEAKELAKFLLGAGMFSTEAEATAPAAFMVTIREYICDQWGQKD